MDMELTLRIFSRRGNYLGDISEIVFLSWSRPRFHWYYRCLPFNLFDILWRTVNFWVTKKCILLSLTITRDLLQWRTFPVLHEENPTKYYLPKSEEFQKRLNLASSQFCPNLSCIMSRCGAHSRHQYPHFQRKYLLMLIQLINLGKSSRRWPTRSYRAISPCTLVDPIVSLTLKMKVHILTIDITLKIRLF